LARKGGKIGQGIKVTGDEVDGENRVNGSAGVSDDESGDFSNAPQPDPSVDESGNVVGNRPPEADAEDDDILARRRKKQGQDARAEDAEQVKSNLAPQEAPALKGDEGYFEWKRLLPDDAVLRDLSEELIQEDHAMLSVAYFASTPTYPTETLLQRWSKVAAANSPQRDQEMDEFKKLYAHVRRVNNRFGGFEQKMIQGTDPIEYEVSNEWNNDSKLKISVVLKPTLNSFINADYGGLIEEMIINRADRAAQRGIIPALHPRHTLKKAFVDRINAAWDSSAAVSWKRPKASRLSNGEPVVETPDQLALRRRVQQSRELKALVQAASSVLVAIAYRYNSYRDFSDGDEERYLTIVDEIHITEQLCNLMYGIRLILLPDRVHDGEWDRWTSKKRRAYGVTGRRELKAMFIEASFNDEELGQLSDPDQVAVMDFVYAVEASAMISTLIKEAMGVDFRLPYMRIVDLRRPDEGGQNMALKWPAPDDVGAPGGQLLMRPLPPRLRLDS
jgi:hypothetical protein